MPLSADSLVCHAASIKEIYRTSVGLSYPEDMHNFLFFKELVIINLTWYWPTPMCLGSIFTNSAKGSNNRLAMETSKEQCTFNITKS